MFTHFLRRGAYSRPEFEALIEQSPFGDAAITRAGIGFSIDLRKATSSLGQAA